MITVAYHFAFLVVVIKLRKLTFITSSTAEYTDRNPSGTNINITKYFAFEITTNKNY